MKENQYNLELTLRREEGVVVMSCHHSKLFLPLSLSFSVGVYVSLSLLYVCVCVPLV